ncbi:MAG TPA: lipopolysaccharide heptosyltransferase I [Blastocatellia bacterium]|nr:lipopolysaccharide heptosyltransferase I [Blastocatellia bacterium]
MMVRLLIVKLGAIGDIVHTLPALARIRKACPEAFIAWAVDKNSAEILRDNPLIDQLIELPTKAGAGNPASPARIASLGREVANLRKIRVDAALDFQGLAKSALAARISGASQRWGFAKANLREPSARFLYSDVVEIPPMSHIIIKNLLLAEKALNLPHAPEEIEFPIATDKRHTAEAMRIIEKAGGDFALLNPAGGWETKLWPAERFGELADRIWGEFGITPILTTAPNEASLAEKAFAASRCGKLFTARPSLKAFYEIARHARIYIGGDTGPTHIAVAAGAPIVGIFGPTEWWRNGSIRPEDVCVERTDIDCRENCHRRTCSKWICMEIGVEKVVDAVAKRLSNE